MTRLIPPGSQPADDAEPQTRPWIVLQSQQEIEAWIARLNHELQQIERTAADRGYGHGVCLSLTHGGEISLHTNSDGDILLEIGPDADWVAPLIVAATGAQTPRGTIWIIPGERLVELIMGLNSLIGSEKLVLRHNFRSRH